LSPIWYMNPSHLTQKSVKLTITVQNFREMQVRKTKWGGRIRRRRKRKAETEKEARLRHFCGKMRSWRELACFMQGVQKGLS